MTRFVPFLAAILFSAAAPAAPPQPFSAVYAVSRDGKAIGETTYRLDRLGDGDWSLTSETRGTAGMARMFGLEVNEASRFRWHGDAVEALSYDYRQDAAIRHKERHAEFDWSANEARVRDNGKDFRYPLEPGTSDRQVVSLAIGVALADGAKDVTIPVAVKDQIERQQYVTRGEETIIVPAGSYATVRIERADAPGKLRSWYAPQTTPAPIRLEQRQGDGSTILLELKSLDG